MSYITKEQLIAFYGADEVSEVSDERFALILASTDAKIDDAVQRHLPFQTIPPLLTALAVDMVRYDIMSDGRLYDEIKLKGLRQRYDDALKLLELIKSGTLMIGDLQQSLSTVIFTSRPREEI